MSTLQITWERIFPSLIRNNLITAITAKDPDYLHKHIHAEDSQTTKFGETNSNKKSIRKQKILFRMLIPECYRMMPYQIDMTDDMIPNMFSRFFKYSDNYGLKYYTRIKDQIIKEAKTGNYDFYSLPFTKTLNDNLKTLLSFMEAENLRRYQEDILSIINEMNISKNSILKDKLSILSTVDFYDQITCLVTIASVWACLEDIY
ncbi:MAG: hypothetical protein Q4D81_07555, partial [Eubacteriales bacterium]|nr:hypothetical protein [Eubacteriales bacterium]